MAADRRQGGIDRRCKRQQHQAERDADGVETRFWVQFLLFLTVPLVGCGAQAPERSSCTLLFHWWGAGRRPREIVFCRAARRRGRKKICEGHSPRTPLEGLFSKFLREKRTHRQIFMNAH